MATEPQVHGSVPFPVPLLKPSQLSSTRGTQVRWLWHGYLGARMLTGLVSRGKSGKTTLASILLTLLKAGGDLGGRAVAAGKAVVVTEESTSTWAERCERLHIPEENVRLLCRPFRGTRPTPAEWRTLVDQFAALHREEAFDLLIVDPLAGFLPGGAENYAPAMVDFLLPLQALAEAGPAISLLHHPGKRAQADGHAGRGSSALLGFVDILIEMSCCKALHSANRRRRLRAFSRNDATPRHLLIELNAEGTAYTVPVSTVDPMSRWPEIFEIFEQAISKLSAKEILERWPEGSKRPGRSTLWRWLKRIADQGRLSCESTGRHGDTYFYWLPERTELMRPDSSAGPEAMDAWNARYLNEVFNLRNPTAINSQIGEISGPSSCQHPLEQDGILPPTVDPTPDDSNAAHRNTHTPDPLLHNPGAGRLNDPPPTHPTTESANPPCSAETRTEPLPPPQLGGPRPYLPYRPV